MARAMKTPWTADLSPDEQEDTTAPALDVRRIQSSYRQVADQLRDLIVRGDLVTGQRLPSEAEMAPLFGVSRLTIREALRILVTDGLLVTRRGARGGTFVADLDPLHISGVLNTAFGVLAMTQQVPATDFLETWRAIEAPASRLAAHRQGGDQVEQLLTLSTLVGAKAGEADRVQQATDFHFALLKASGNLLLEALGRPVSMVARSLLAGSRPSEEFWRRNTAEHRRIAEAIAAGDEESAEREAVSHIEATRRHYESDSTRASSRRVKGPRSTPHAAAVSGRKRATGRR